MSRPIWSIIDRRGIARSAVALPRWLAIVAALSHMKALCVSTRTPSRLARSIWSGCIRLEELAELDELTGAFNRRCIMRGLEEEISRGQRTGSPCSIALIDLDFFKRINDAFGHPTVDEVLRTFAISMFANIRTIDRSGRYGGEE